MGFIDKKLLYDGDIATIENALVNKIMMLSALSVFFRPAQSAEMGVQMLHWHTGFSMSNVVCRTPLPKCRLASLQAVVHLRITVLKKDVSCQSLATLPAFSSARPAETWNGRPHRAPLGTICPGTLHMTCPGRLHVTRSSTRAGHDLPW